MTSKHTRYTLSTLCALSIAPIYTYAQIIKPPTKFTDLSQVVTSVVNIVQVLLIMATTLYLIYAGLMFVTARGEPSKITKARDALLWGMVGAALILAARVMVTAIQGGVNSILR